MKLRSDSTYGEHDVLKKPRILGESLLSQNSGLNEPDLTDKILGTDKSSDVLANFAHSFGRSSMYERVGHISAGNSSPSVSTQVESCLELHALWEKCTSFGLECAQQEGVSDDFRIENTIMSVSELTGIVR